MEEKCVVVEETSVSVLWWRKCESVVACLITHFAMQVRGGRIVWMERVLCVHYFVPTFLCVCAERFDPDGVERGVSGWNAD